jgi:signal transduction histidine kinase
MPSHWPAVGAETDLLKRARQLQRSWERLLADGALGPELPPKATAELRPTIVESWRRSLATGLDPTDLLAPIVADESEVVERWFEHPLGSLTHVLTEQLGKVAEESRGMVVVTDASGLVLHRVGDEWLKERAAAEMNLVEGARYSEATDGTNGIGTALAAHHAFQVFAFEHFNERHHQWVCSGAPVRDPVSGQTVGLIDLSSLWKDAHPRSLELVTTAARTIEWCLVDARRERDARLRHRYSDFMTRSTDLLVDRDGSLLDGSEPAHPSPFDIPEGGGEVVLGDGSVAVAEPLGQGEAYLVRRPASRGAKLAPVELLERAEEHVRELATEQAALRRVATLVARESSPDQLFAVVAEQVARVFEIPHVRLVRYEPDGSVVVGGFSEGDPEPFPIGSRWPLDSPGVIASVRKTGRPARVENYADVTGEVAAVVRGAGMRSTVASPIVVERRLWGAMVVLSPRLEPFPEDTEAGLTDFTELVATAIANAEARQALARLADEQAALRRVATLVARGTEPVTVFRAVCNEAQALLGADRAAILRFHDDRTVTVMAASGGQAQHRFGTRISFDPGFVVDWVHETHQGARFDTDDPAAAGMPEVVRMLGVRSAVGSPIVVDGELWGVITLASVDRSLPLGMERRLADFTELVAAAIANAESKSALNASRRRIVAAADKARRRIERDLHDGVQQQLVSLTLKLGAMEAEQPAADALEEQLASLKGDVGSVLEGLLEIARGIHPAILSQGGLGTALKGLARRSAVPVELDAHIESPLRDEVEVAAYYVVSEALTNVAKYARASTVHIDVTTDDGTLTLVVRDDGVGGADPGKGSGLVGLQDRVEALGGTITIDSSAGNGTCVAATLPAATEAAEEIENVLGRPQELGSPTSPA